MATPLMSRSLETVEDHDHVERDSDFVDDVKTATKRKYPWYGSSNQEPNEEVSRCAAGGGLLETIRKDDWLLPLVYCEFWIAGALSLIQPFFPILAYSKGLDAWEIGLVFSAFKLSMFMGSLLGNKMMKATSPLTCYLVGQIGFVVFIVAFGCLFWAPAGNVFLGLSFLLVVLGGFTNTLYLVAMFALFTTRFQKGAGLVMALLEILWGSGNMVGSPIGGALIDLWDFPLPFFVLGIITIISFPIIVKLGKKLNELGRESPLPEDIARRVDVRYSNLLRDVEFVAYLVAPTLCWVILGFNEPTLAPSVGDFNLTSTQTGEIYTVQFAGYSIGGAIAGIICFFNGEAFYIFLGDIFVVIAYLIVGPAPFIHQKRQLWIVYLSQVFTGFGMSALFICGYSRALKLVVLRGYPYNIHSNGFVSSTVFTFAVFGAMITSPIAGYLVQTFGYRIASMAMFGLLLAWLPATFALWIKSLCSPDKVRIRDVTE